MKPDTTTSRTFLLACFLLSLYQITSFDMQSTHYGFIRLYLLAIPLSTAAFIHFSLFFPEPGNAITRYPIFQFVPYIIGLILLLPMEFLYPAKEFYIFWQLVSIYIAVSVFTFLYPLISSYIKPKSVLAKQRAKVVLLGSAIAFPIPAIAVVSRAFTGSFFFCLQTTLINMILLVFPVAIAYAIIKHNLFDVDVYIKRTVGYVILTILVGLTYLAIQMLTKSVIFSPLLGDHSEQVDPIVFAILVVFFFNPAKEKIQIVVDRIFFRKKYDYQETVLSMSNTLSSVLNLDEIVKQMIYTVRREMFIDTAGIILFEQTQKEYQIFLPAIIIKPIIYRIADNIINFRMMIRFSRCKFR